MNVLGKPVDQLGPIVSDTYYPIHRPAPSLRRSVHDARNVETGIKVVDLIEPYVKGGKIGLFGGAGVGKTVLIMETHSQRRDEARGVLRVRGVGGAHSRSNEPVLEMSRAE